MGRQDLTELSPIFAPSPTTTAGSGRNLKEPGVGVVGSEESYFGLWSLDANLGPEPGATLVPISPNLTTLFGDSDSSLDADRTLLDLEGEETTVDLVSLLQLSSVPVANEATGLDSDRPFTELNLPPVELQNLTTPIVSTSDGYFTWPQENMGVHAESITTTDSSQERIPGYQVSASATTVSSCDVGHEVWSKPPTFTTPPGSLPDFVAPMEAGGQPPDAVGSTPMKKRLRRDFIHYPSEYVIQGVTFSRELFAKAYMQPNMVKTTKYLFRALFKDEDLSNQNLSGRNGVECLDQKKLNAISTLAWWMDQDKSQGRNNPYAISTSEVSEYGHPAEEMKDVRRKAYVETRNELGRKRRRSEVVPSSRCSRIRVKRRRQTSSH